MTTTHCLNMAETLGVDIVSDAVSNKTNINGLGAEKAGGKIWELLKVLIVDVMDILRTNQCYKEQS